MRTASLSVGHFRNGDKKYWIHVNKSVWWKYLIYKAYHAYDMKVPCKIPGWNRFERWLGKHDAEMDGKRIRDRLVSWTVKQDLRCYYLSEKAKEHLMTIEVNPNDYEKLKAGK